MRLVLLTVLMFVAQPALATLTTRVDGLEEGINETWQQGGACQSLRVEDLAFRDNSFALTTSGQSVFRLSRDDRGGVFCSAGGWRIAAWEAADSVSTSCAPAICRVLEANHLIVSALDAAFTRAPTAIDEAPIPLTWSTPYPKGLSLVWFLCCLTTLVLLLALPVVMRLTGPRTQSSTLHAVDWVLILAIALGGVGLRAVVAQRAMVELDETVSVGYDSLWREFDGRETVMNPPLYRVISAPLSARTHGAAVPGRAVPVLLGFPLVVVLAWLASFLIGRRAAIFAAALAAVHPWLVMATVYHRSYAPLVVTTALTLAAVAVALRSSRQTHRYVAAVCLAATFLSHYSGAAVIVGAALWIAWADRARWRMWIGPAALTVMLCAPFVPAALSGAHAKGNSPIGTAGVAHAQRLALSMASVVGGLVRPRLETPIYLEHPQTELVKQAVLVVLALLVGVVLLWRRGGLALLTITVLAGALPVFMAVRLTTVREFQGVEAAVPAVILLCALATPTRSRLLSVLSTIAMLGLLVACIRALPFDRAARTELDAASSFVREHQGQWPVFVWSTGSPSYSDVALDLGLSRPLADASYEGRDAKVRALRSCSAAAVRDAARTGVGTNIAILSIDSSCDGSVLSGRGVSCEPSQRDVSGFVTTTCHVEQAVVSPVATLPSLVPAHLRRRVDRAIPPGHEPLFMSASAPYQLGKADVGGDALVGISIGMEYAKYQLKTTSGVIVTVLATPQFSDDEITGTELTVEPAEATMAPDAKAATVKLKDALSSHLTVPVWNDVYGLVTNGAGGHSPVKPLPWLVLSGLAAVVLLGALARRVPPTVVND